MRSSLKYSNYSAVAEYLARGSKYTKVFSIKYSSNLAQAESAAYKKAKDYAERQGIILLDYDLFPNTPTNPLCPNE